MLLCKRSKLVSVTTESGCSLNLIFCCSGVARAALNFPEERYDLAAIRADSKENVLGTIRDSVGPLTSNSSPLE